MPQRPGEPAPDEPTDSRGQHTCSRTAASTCRSLSALLNASAKPRRRACALELQALGALIALALRSERAGRPSGKELPVRTFAHIIGTGKRSIRYILPCVLFTNGGVFRGRCISRGAARGLERTPAQWRRPAETERGGTSTESCMSRIEGFKLVEEVQTRCRPPGVAMPRPCKGAASASTRQHAHMPRVRQQIRTRDARGVTVCMQLSYAADESPPPLMRAALTCSRVAGSRCRQRYR